MNKPRNTEKTGGTATVILLAFLLFYLPSMLAILTHRHDPDDWVLASVMMATFYTMVFAINYYFLVPRLLSHVINRGWYIACNFILIVMMCAFIPIWFESHGGLPGPHNGGKLFSTGQYLIGYLGFIIRDSVMMILSAGLAFALRISRERENMRRRELELNAERKQIELKSLKAQLNPHFLFNSLNNIYALIAFAPERAQKALHDLSSLLRFMIYDSAVSTVALEKEFQFISEYVELMKLRLNDGVQLKCDLAPVATEGLRIAPLIFITLVENSFKHLGSSGDVTIISIEAYQEDGNLIFNVENTYTEENKDLEIEGKRSGVGLENVRRQLSLLYPDAATLKVGKENGIFSARISIKCSVLTDSQEAVKSAKNC